MTSHSLFVIPHSLSAFEDQLFSHFTFSELSRDNPFVKISAFCCIVSTWTISTSRLSTFDQKKWYFTGCDVFWTQCHLRRRHQNSCTIVVLKHCRLGRNLKHTVVFSDHLSKLRKYWKKVSHWLRERHIFGLSSGWLREQSLSAACLATHSTGAPDRVMT